MLARLGGFSPAVGDEYADLDLAFRAADAGWHTACEAKSKVFYSRIPRPARNFNSGISAERFFWRHLPASGRGRAMAAHVACIAGELLSCVWRPRNAMQVLGRLAGWWPAPAQCPPLPWPVVEPRKGRREAAKIAPSAAMTNQRRVA